jgi:hypothetical protein
MNLLGRQEVVIKPLEDYLQEHSGFCGATILGDGGYFVDSQCGRTGGLWPSNGRPKKSWPSLYFDRSMRRGLIRFMFH